MTVGRIDDDSVDTGANKGLGTQHRVGSNADTGSHAQAAARILACGRLILSLGYIFICDKTDELAVGIDNGQFLDFMTLEYIGSLLEGCAKRGCHKVVASHHLIDTAALVALETQVAVGNYTDQFAALVDHGNTTDVVLAHHAEGIGYRRTFEYGDGVVNHAVFSTLYGMYLAGLLLNRHVFMDNTQATLTGNGNGKLALGNRIHRRRDDRNIERYVTGEARGKVYLAWKHI